MKFLRPYISLEWPLRRIEKKFGNLIAARSKNGCVALNDAVEILANYKLLADFALNGANFSKFINLSACKLKI